MIILNTLPPNHPLRNTPLAQLGVKYRWVNSNAWLSIGERFGIAKCTFNQLGSVWVENDLFGVEE